MLEELKRKEEEKERVNKVEGKEKLTT